MAASGGLFALYGHVVVGLQFDNLVAPIGTAVTAAALVLLTLFGAGARQSTGFNRNAPAWYLLIAALLWFSVETAMAMLGRPISVNDLGVAFLVVGIPFMLIAVDRTALLLLISKLCLGLALLDAVVNLLAYLNLVTIELTARVEDFEVIKRYPGLTGSTMAAGLVAFVAMIYVASRVKDSRGGMRIVLVALLAVVIASMVAIDARRYLAMGIYGSALILCPTPRVPMLAHTVALATIMLVATFSAGAGDVGNLLRAQLMLHGVDQALAHPIVGEGLFYRADLDIAPNFNALVSSGVTESTILDYAIAGGVVGAVLFLLPICWVLARSSRYDAQSVILAMMGAELCFGGSVHGLLGALVFYLCLVGVIWDDKSAARRTSAATRFTSPPLPV